MDLTPEEKAALLEEAVEKAKAELAKEAKADIEKINKLIADERKAHEDLLKGKMTAADFKTYEEKSQVAEAEIKARVDAVETKMNRPPTSDPDGKAIVPGAKEYKAAFFNFLRKGELVLDEAAQKYIDERKALVSDATGQILIPEELESEIYRELPKINVVRKYATIKPIIRDRIRRRSLTEVAMGWGKLELGKELVESDATPSEDYQYVEDLEGLAKIGKDELADTDIALEAAIIDSFNRARSETEETAFIAGTAHANEQPDGILNGTTVTRVKTAAADAISVDDVYDLLYAVPAQYRRGGVFMFPSTTLLALRKLKDKDEQYLWQPSVQAGQPASLAGYPVEAQEDIPAIAASAECDIGIFGDFRAGYRILDRQGMKVQRLLELFATAGLIGILVSSRVGGGVIRADALRILQELA